MQKVPPSCERSKLLGHKVFLDLKFHDIPNTVQGAVRSAAGLDADMLNLHAMGGEEMMRGAMKELEGREKKPLLIAVTVLTSMDEETLKSELHVSLSSGRASAFSGEDLQRNQVFKGVVCSALEVPKLKKALGEDFLTITPGIRPQESASGDQKRVVTPAMARELGSDFIVVGRPITKAEDPYAAYLKIRAEFMGGERI